MERKTTIGTKVRRTDCDLYFKIIGFNTREESVILQQMYVEQPETLRVSFERLTQNFKFYKDEDL